jgi:hypothetical protein
LESADQLPVAMKYGMQYVGVALTEGFAQR